MIHDIDLALSLCPAALVQIDATGAPVIGAVEEDIGAARLRFADETEARELRPGDFVDIAPHRRHRVDWTDPEQPTVWLAIHYAQ